jgi:hypothetical protein
VRCREGEWGAQVRARQRWDGSVRWRRDGPVQCFEGGGVTQGGLPARIDLLAHPSGHKDDDVSGGGGAGSVGGVGDGDEAVVALVLRGSPGGGPAGDFKPLHLCGHLRLHRSGSCCRGSSFVSLGLGDLLLQF